MPNQLVSGGVLQGTSQACIIDITPPSFAGITALVANSNGSLQATWGVATDSTPPITYRVYVQAGTAVGLFQPSNLALATTQVTAKIFTLASGSVLISGVTYYVGVKAVDAVGNVDNNTVSMSAISNGVLDGEVNYELRAVFSVDAADYIVGTFWVLRDGVATTGLLGLGSYEMLDYAGIPVGISQTGISPDSNGLYNTAAVSSAGIVQLTHYTMKLTVIVDGQPRIGYYAITLGVFDNLFDLTRQVNLLAILKKDE